MQAMNEFRWGQCKVEEVTGMNSKQFRAVLDWRMCSDPWPGGDEETVDEWLNEMARTFGFEHWIQAYHELGA